MIGKVIGTLTVKTLGKRPTHIKTRDKYYICECSACGKEYNFNGRSLKRGKRTGCDCKTRERKVEGSKGKNINDLSGKVFNIIKVIGDSGERSQRAVLWECICLECGRGSKRTGPQLKGEVNSCMCQITGDKHYKWRDDITDEERVKKRLSGKLIAWRNKVYERDNYKCQCCGDNTGGNLNAHHLDGWNWCEEKRLDIDNGITLCEDCHNDFHEKNGFGDNTREQFLLFLKEIV